MKKYLNKIELVQNYRGVWDLDPFKGCKQSEMNGGKGCYGVCYAAALSRARGYDFSDVVYRYFINDEHFKETITKLKKTPFVRMGVMCDPSHDWAHTLELKRLIKPYQKNIVIITKHWNILEEKQMGLLDGTIVNTSVSALDTSAQIKTRLREYERLKNYCRSLLRVNTCNFNDEKMSELQDTLLENEGVIENILRVPKSHKMVEDGLINVNKTGFLGSDVYASVRNDNVFFGFCFDCPDLCGATPFQKKITEWCSDTHYRAVVPDGQERGA